MSTPFRLAGISGSLRTNSYSATILEALAEAIAPRATVEFIDIGGLPHHNQDMEAQGLPEAVLGFRAQIGEADAVLIVSSEYNHGIPGVLKNALDWGSRPVFRSAFKGKPILIVTSSPAFTGGVRAQYQLRETLFSMLARPVPVAEIVIGQVHTKIVDGRFVDSNVIGFALEAMEVLFDEIVLLQSANRHAVAAH